MRKRLVLTLSVLAIASTLGTSSAHAKTDHGTAASRCPGHVKGVYYYRGVTRFYEKKLGIKPSKSNFNASKVRSCRYTLWVAHHWHHRAVRAKHMYVEHLKELQRQQVALGSLTSDWACIHRYEGAWNANTGNGYYGGLQMNIAFQTLYGGEFLKRWGTANNWPVWAQVTAANRAKNSGRGYYPWPNTAHACGLI